MRVSLIDTPSKYGNIKKGGTMIIRVISGTLKLSDTQQNLSMGGLEISSGDGVVSFPWDHSEVWMRANSTAEAEVIIPA